MATADPSAEDNRFLQRTIEVGIRVGLIVLLVAWCILILRPFIQPLVWGLVIAVAVHPIYARVERGLGGRSRSAAALLVLAALLLLIGPTVALTASLVETATNLAGELHGGTFAVPPPPSFVADWPVVGQPLNEFWTLANQNLESALRKVGPQLKTIGIWLVSTGATTGIGIVMFIVSILIAGVLLANGAAVGAAADGISRRLAGEQGSALLGLARDTVQNVTRGILGVALIQSLLAGVGMLAVGVPAAGLWTLLVLVLAVIQLPPLLVMIPVILYVFSTSSTVVAVIFAIYSAAVMLSDNVLKPMLMGRGASVPVLVIFMGAIGGFMLEGIIGLFTGAVVLALSYTLFHAWLERADSADEPAGA
ncbi:MAG: AI-2E family transporter [Myxococcota bacterium]